MINDKIEQKYNSVGYYSNDVGDLYIQGSCNGILSLQTYVQDCWRWDSGATDKSSAYTKTNATMTHTDDYYDCYDSVYNGWGYIYYPLIDATNYHLSFTMKLVSGVSNNQMYIRYMDGNSLRISPWTDEDILGYQPPESQRRDRWWHCEIEKINGNIICKVYDDSNTLMHTQQYTSSGTADYLFGVGSWGGYGHKYIKNIKIKRL